jgi:hypothetical protein
VLQVNGGNGLCCERSTVLLGLMVMMLLLLMLVVLVKVLMLLLLLLLLLCSVRLLCNLAPHGPFNCSDNVLQPCSHVKSLMT